jgi:hypothetical protein
MYFDLIYLVLRVVVAFVAIGVIGTLGVRRVARLGADSDPIRKYLDEKAAR